MGRINLAEFGSRSQKLQQEDLQGACAVLTVASVEQRTISDHEAQGGQRTVLILAFHETGDKTLWLNWVAEIKAVAGQLGDDTDLWKGRQVPVERVTRHYRGESFKKVAIADPARWAVLFEQAGGDNANSENRRTAIIQSALNHSESIRMEHGAEGFRENCESVIR